MKILSLIGLSAAGILSAFASTPVLAQSMSTQFLTCRTALEGTPFEEVDQAEAPSCCYVVEEIVWYTENDVLVNRFYLNTDDRIHYTTDVCKPTMDSAGTAFAPGADVDPTTTGSVGPTTPGTADVIPVPPVANFPDDDEVTPPVETGDEGPNNPGNENPVGGAGEQPNGTDYGPVPSGTKGKSDS